MILLASVDLLEFVLPARDLRVNIVAVGAGWHTVDFNHMGVSLLFCDASMRRYRASARARSFCRTSGSWLVKMPQPSRCR